MWTVDHGRNGNQACWNACYRPYPDGRVGVNHIRLIGYQRTCRGRVAGCLLHRARERGPPAPIGPMAAPRDPNRTLALHLPDGRQMRPRGHGGVVIHRVGQTAQVPQTKGCNCISLVALLRLLLLGHKSHQEQRTDPDF